MTQTTLCFLVKEGEVLLAMKKRGFGAGKWNGVGGKLKENENNLEAAIREIKEEIGIKVAARDLKPAGMLDFQFDSNSAWNQMSHIFLIETWSGEPTESDEMRPQWYTIDRLPFEAMWVDDPHWLPRVLAGEVIEGKFLFGKDGAEMLKCEVIIKK